MRPSKDSGVAPVIGTLLLVVITVSAFGLAYGAYSSWINTQRVGSMVQMQERVNVEVVWFTSSTTASLYISNIGDSEVTITQVHINGGSTTIDPASLSIMPGSSSWVEVTWSGTFIIGSEYSFSVITNRGTIAETFASR